MNSPRPCLSTFALKTSILLYSMCLVVMALSPGADLHEKMSQKMGKKNEPLPPCLACRTLVNSFHKGMEDTSRGKFEGGDADWEESRLKNYANSELRLVEIQEKLCTELDKGQEQCLIYAEEHEATIEEWWFRKRKEEPKLHTFLCILHLKVCCPPNHFGPECKPCNGGIENPCGGHGKCKGNGTRKGSGVCKCDPGYTGDLCQSCSKGYFVNETVVDAIECSKCHKSCAAHCREAGPKGCEVCAEGYQHITEYGCIDVDECVELDQSPCSGNTFCANTDGSYICMECDKVCNGCNGDGPDMCNKCADGYGLKDGVCIETTGWRKSLKANFARYVTYLGFFVAVFIISKRNQNLAYFVAAIVAGYIAVAEYLLGDYWADILTLDTLKSSFPL